MTFTARRLASPARTAAAAVCALGLLGGGRALAQEVNYENPSGINALPTRGNTAGDGGFLVSSDMVMHAGVGAEAGYDSNVFYNDSATSSPLLRVTPFLELTNVSRGGARPTGAEFDLAGSLLYRRYISDDANVTRQDAFNPTVSGSLGLHPGQQVTFSLADTFSRDEMPPYAPTERPFQRNTNLAAASLRFAPGGGRIQGTIQYMNRIEIFEGTSARTRNNMNNEVLLDAAWLWLPKTAIYLRARQGLISYFNAGPSGSMPLRVVLGLRGLVTPKLSVNVSGGYANAFYDSGTSTSGWLGSTNVDVLLTYRSSLTNQISGGYHHDFQNALVGNFFYTNAVFLGMRQLIGSRLAAVVSARYDMRNYQGPDTNDLAPMGAELVRHDNILMLGATLDYGLRHGIYFGVGYSASVLGTDYDLGGRPLDYAKHQVFGRLGIAY